MNEFIQLTQNDNKPVWIGYGIAITGGDQICTVHVGSSHFTLNQGVQETIKVLNEHFATLGEGRKLHRQAA